VLQTQVKLHCAIKIVCDILLVAYKCSISDYVYIGILLQNRWANLKKELLTTIIPMFLSNHPNSVPVLQAAWHCASQSQNVRGLVLHAMAEWYMRGEPHDQSRLSRILDVAQDLKVCSRLSRC